MKVTMDEKLDLLVEHESELEEYALRRWARLWGTVGEGASSLELPARQLPRLDEDFRGTLDRKGCLRISATSTATNEALCQWRFAWMEGRHQLFILESRGPRDTAAPRFPISYLGRSA